MASWLLHRQFLGALIRNRSQTPAIQAAAAAAAAEPVCRWQTHFGSQLSTLTLPQNTSVEESESEAAVEVKSSLEPSRRHDMAMVFTCGVCDTRSVKTMSREAYEKGVVVATCSGCDNKHLIADRLGLFGDPSSVEEFLAERGEEVKKGSVDTLNLTLEDLAGTKMAATENLVK